MSTRMVCDICGRGIVQDGGYVRLSVFQNGTDARDSHYDLCTARNGHDTGCDQFVGSGLATIKERAVEAAEKRGVPLP